MLMQPLKDGSGGVFATDSRFDSVSDDCLDHRHLIRNKRELEVIRIVTGDVHWHDDVIKTRIDPNQADQWSLVDHCSAERAIIYVLSIIAAILVNDVTGFLVAQILI